MLLSSVSPVFSLILGIMMTADDGNCRWSGEFCCLGLWFYIIEACNSYLTESDFLKPEISTSHIFRKPSTIASNFNQVDSQTHT